MASVVIGIRLAPAVFEWLQRVARSSGTMIGLALAFILALSQLASTAKLAPIIGAFVAGICLSRSPTGHRVGNELRSVGAIFIPVFFFRIGVEADVTEFAQPKVLGMAGGAARRGGGRQDRRRRRRRQAARRQAADRPRHAAPR